MGSHPHDSWPDGRATFVFTDIAGSTALVHALGDRYLPLLADHNALLRGAWDAFDGIEVKTDGDSFFVVFADPTRAVHACIAAQRALREHDWPDRVRLHVRMGAHTGEATRVGKDYLGIGVIVAARVMSAAHGDQILITDATADKARLDDGVTLRDLGAHGLKGVAEAPTIFQVISEGLPTVFPPPVSLRATRHNIPQPPSPLRGRGELLSQAHALLLGEARVVSVVGTGGIGKTRFALEVAHDLLAYIPGGIFWVGCAPLIDDDALAVAIGGEFGVEFTADVPRAEQIAAALTDQTLLVLDNLEHLQGAPQLIADLVSASPHLRILATSRHRLRIRTEQALKMDPLEVPSDGESSLDHVERTPAGAVFLDKARATDLVRRWSDADAPLVATIVRELDGVPLALELAASRLGELDLAEIEAGLAKATQILSDGDVDLPARQRSMVAAIGWSIDLLDQDAREVLSAASVFRGGAARDALEAVLGRPADVRALVRASLVQVDHERVKMLEPVRAAAEALAEHVDDFRRSHVAWFEDLAARSWGQLAGHHQDEWLARLAPETANIDTAMTYADDVKAVQIAAHLGRWWGRTGRALEGEERITRALRRAPEDAPARAHAMMVLGNLERQLGRIERARATLQDAASSAAAGGDREIELFARIQLGEIERLAGNTSLAIEILQVAADDARAAGAPSLAARAESNLALVVREQDLGRSDALLLSAEENFTAEGDEHNAALISLNRAALFADARRVDEAREALAPLVAKDSDLVDRSIRALLAINLGWIAYLSDDLVAAQESTRAGIELFRDLQDRTATAQALTNLFTILEASEEPHEALAAAREALAMSRGNQSLTPGLVRAATILALRIGDPGTALEILIGEEASLENGPDAAANTLILAVAQARLGNHDGASTTLEIVRERDGAERIPERVRAMAAGTFDPDTLEKALGPDQSP